MFRPTATRLKTWHRTAYRLQFHSNECAVVDVGKVVGDNILVVVDPTTNTAVGAVLFTLNQINTGKP
jgi:hypothetical protein